MKGLIVALTASLTLVFGAVDASATDRLVAAPGSDAGDCSVLPCATINYAAAQALDGDTVRIGPGSFPLTTNVLIANKSLSVIGAGVDDTLIDGQNATLPGSAHGMFRITASVATPRDVAFTDFSVVNVAKIASGNAAYAIWANASNNTVNLSVEDVKVTGPAPDTTPAVTAVSVTNNNGDVLVDGLQQLAASGSGVVTAQQRGNLTVQNSNFEIIPTLSTWAVSATSSGAGADIPGDYTISDNSFSGVYGANVSTTSTAANPVNFSGQITVSGNSTQGATSSSSAGIRVQNTPSPNTAPSSGSIEHVTISGNKLTGQNGNGILISGDVKNSQIEHNVITGYLRGINLANNGADPANAPTGTVVTANRLAGNKGQSTRPYGLTLGSNASDVNADANWWGCNDPGPASPTAPPVNAPCDALQADPSQVTRDSWIQLLIVAHPEQTLQPGQSSDLTIRFDKMNDGSAAPAIFPDGTIVPLTTTRGSVAPGSVSLVDGTAEAVFTSDNWRGNRSVSASFDGQVTTHRWDDFGPAGDLYVEKPANGGVDSDTCGPLGNPPCETIQQAIDNALPSDRIFVGIGTFSAGSGVNVDKTLEIIGSGEDKTFVDGEDSASLSQHGTIAFTGDDATQSISNLSVIHPGSRTGSSWRYAFFLPNRLTPSSVTIEHVTITGPGAGVNSMGLETGVIAGDLTINDLTTNDIPGVQLLIQRALGNVLVENSTLNTLGSTTTQAIIDSSYQLGQPGAVTSPHVYRNNTINARNGIWVNAGSASNPGLDFNGITIENNTFNDPVGSADTVAISLNNAALNPDGDDAHFGPVVITGNTINARTGILLRGLVEDAQIERNVIRDGNRGLHLTSAATGKVPVGTVFNANQVVNAANAAVLVESVVPVGANLDENWWGCNDGPNVGANPDAGPCGRIVAADSSGLNLDSWIVLRLDAVPASLLPVTGSAALTVGLDQLNTGDPAPQIFADGTVLAMSTTGGDLLNPSATTTAGVGSNVFTSSQASGRTASVSFDNQTTVHSWDANSTPTVTITSPADGLITNVPNIPLNYTVSGGNGVVTCNHAEGSTVTLHPGINTILLTCSDEVGNSSSAATSVIYDNTPPQITILTPVDGTVTRENSVRLNYLARDDYGIAFCTPDDGVLIPLATGTNTVAVSCTDRAGNVTTATVTVHHPDPLPACARDVAITDVTRTGARTRLRGIARSQYIGKKVKIQYQPSGKKTIATPKVKADGSWSVVVNRPKKPAWTSNSARYRAILRSTSTAWIKLSRRMGATAVTDNGNGTLRVSGSVSLPIAKGQPVRVERSDACGRYRQIGTLKMKSKGTFGGNVPSGGGAEAAVYIRIKARVAKSSNPRYRFNTYSIVQPVIVSR